MITKIKLPARVTIVQIGVQDLEPDFQDRFVSDIEIESRYVVFDVSAIGCLTSLQIVSLVSVYQMVKVKANDVVLSGVSSDFDRVLSLLRLREIFRVYDSVDAVLAHWERTVYFDDSIVEYSNGYVVDKFEGCILSQVNEERQKDRPGNFRPS